MSEHIADVVLNETDRDLMQLAARILTALDSGKTRIGALETIIQAYRDDIGEAHPGALPEMLNGLAEGFGGALLLEMERVMEDRAEPLRSSSDWMSGVSLANRGHLVEAIGRYLKMVKPAVH